VLCSLFPGSLLHALPTQVTQQYSVGVLWCLLHPHLLLRGLAPLVPAAQDRPRRTETRTEKQKIRLAEQKNKKSD